MRAQARVSLALAAAFVVWLAAPGLARMGDRFSFMTLEGSVLEVGEHRGKGDLPLLSMVLAVDGAPGQRVTVLLAPTDASRDIGLVVEEGDRVRVRVFVTEPEAPVKAQKILNLTRGVMARLRTMHDIPLWDSAGAWQGGAGRAYRGGHHGTRHGGANRSGQGPGGL